MREGKRLTAFVAFAGLIGAVLFAPAPARAEIYELHSGNSMVTVDTTANHGMVTWDLGGVTYMSEQRFFYRIGDSGGEARLDSLASTYTQSSASTLTMEFTSPQFDARVDLNLYYAGSGSASLGEFITITNTTGSLLDFHFFQYANFDMSGAGQSGDDWIYFEADNHVVQSNNNGATVGETVNTSSTPVTAHEAGADLWSSLIDGNPTTLSGLPVSGDPAVGPFDAAWAFQWDSRLAPGSTLQIIKGKQLQVVPAPGAAVLAVVGLGLLGWVKRRFL